MHTSTGTQRSTPHTHTCLCRETSHTHINEKRLLFVCKPIHQICFETCTANAYTQTCLPPFILLSIEKMALSRGFYQTGSAKSVSEILQHLRETKFARDTNNHACLGGVVIPWYQISRAFPASSAGSYGWHSEKATLVHLTGTLWRLIFQACSSLSIYPWPFPCTVEVWAARRRMVVQTRKQGVEMAAGFECLIIWSLVASFSPSVWISHPPSASAHASVRVDNPSVCPVLYLGKRFHLTNNFLKWLLSYMI